MDKLRGLVLRTKNFTRQVTRTLEQLSQNVGRRPQPIPVRVPIRQSKPRFIRNFSTYHSYNYSSYQSNILRLFKHKGFLFHNFSSTYQSSFRLKIYNANIKFTYRTLFNNLREKFQVYQEKPASKSTFNPSLRLNLSLSPKNHFLTLKLSKSDSTATRTEKFISNNLQVSTYIDFPINFNLNIPNETIFNEEILDEMMFNIQLFEKKLKQLKSDLVNLFELGELPIKYISSKNVLRVYFPNCDREKLEILVKDKNIIGGIIVEEEEEITKPREVSYNSDIVSCNTSLSNTISSDVISSDSSVYPLLDRDIIRPSNEYESSQVSINDDYHWV